MIQFRIDTDTGNRHEIEAPNFRDAIREAHRRENEMGTREDRRVTGLVYFHPDHQQWIIADELLNEE